MTNLQNPDISNPTNPIEIDAFVYDLQLKLSTNISWLTHAYGRAYNHVQFENGKYLIYPEVYSGNKTGKYDYIQPRPDNDKKGKCFFVVGPEENINFEENGFNFLRHDIGIVFECNLELIDSALLQTEIFTQHLINEVRNVLTRKLIGTFYKFEIKTIVREFNQVYKEYSYNRKENYLKAPLQAFRVNGTITYQEDCINPNINRCDIVQDNISFTDKICILPGYDFSQNFIYNSLTPEQKQILKTQIENDTSLNP